MGMLKNKRGEIKDAIIKENKRGREDAGAADRNGEYR
jgi:hypothetical protein